MVSAVALIPVEKSLDCSLDMTLGDLGASATGELKGGWNNPFGISQKFTIGPVLSIIFEQGPRGLGDVGDVKFGNVLGS